MNEASKLMGATALVALGLGLAYLCGPPADTPQVVHDLNLSPEALRVGPPDALAATAPLRLHADAAPSPESSSGGAAHLLHFDADPPAEGVILSAAEAEADGSAMPTSDEPRWFAPVRGDNPNPLPPRSVEVDAEAAPLSSVVPAAAIDSATNDQWLITAPAMSHSYDAKPVRAKPSPSLASDGTTHPADAARDAWWTRDTPRLQGLSGSAPAKSSDPAPQIGASTGVGVKLAQPVTPNTRLVGPIDLNTATSSDPVVKPTNTPQSNSPLAVPREFEPPVIVSRTHLVADGDTLARLAERYLQDAKRAPELFELNREVLRNPDLLPIGAALRVPGRPEPSEPELGDTTAIGRMVPVAAAPRSAGSQAHARLQSPEPIAASGW
ncbi:MAG: hypothetical protein WD851_23030 [Pirellulales bacterium]